jgi:hypothetical protein
MKVVTKTLVASTALTLTMSAAQADSNAAYLKQEGSGTALLGGQTAIITQVGEDNTAGFDSNFTNSPNGEAGGGVYQLNNGGQVGNYLQITQTGENNDAGTAATQIGANPSNNGSGFYQMNQDGAAPVRAWVEQNNSATSGTKTGNKITTFFQQNGAQLGSETTAYVDQIGDGNIVKYWKQLGFGPAKSGHYGNLTQQGNRNLVNRWWQAGYNQTATLSIVGSDNGSEQDLIPQVLAAPSVYTASHIMQSGNSNTTDLTINGSFNQFGIRQSGSSNEADGLSIAGDNNILSVGQWGLENTATVEKIDGSTNNVSVYQDGSYNEADIDIIIGGAVNVVGVKQMGSELYGKIDIDGGATNNGGGTTPGTLSLMSGLIEQNDNHHTATVTIDGSNNDFGVRQSGAGALIASQGSKANATILGSDNTAEILQAGLTNDALISIGSGGSFNELAVSQVGDNMTGKIYVLGAGSNNGSGLAIGNLTTGNLGLTSGLIQQTGDWHTATVTIDGSNNDFGVRQSGAGALIASQGSKANVTIEGSYNTVEILQAGLSNNANTIQTGAYNTAVISQ